MERTHFNEHKVVTILQRLVQKGLIQIEQHMDENGVHYEYYDFNHLWELLVDCVEQQNLNKEDEEVKGEEGEIYKLFEAEFGRLLSPMEYETIGMWFDQDKHSASLIRLALKEAVLSQKAKPALYRPHIIRVEKEKYKNSRSCRKSVGSV